MRPIRLEIAGLQSFEKKQLIDFEYLSEYGLFGIFGPTGSGKSTVLDAITLALYGDVVRIKSSGRQGNINDILNINSSEIYVAFSFEIASDRYFIERSFKAKKGERTIGSKKVLMTKNDDVIADKINDIADEIMKIIGLGMDDFTRSVILPQGKFSEFLKLSGVERRAMLERLFNLESYGRSFLNKIRDRKNEHLREINAIDNQIKGKGLVEIEIFKNLEGDIAEVLKEIELISPEIKQMEEGLAELRVLMALEDELLTYKKELEKLEEDREDIKNLGTQIERSEEASIVNKKYIQAEEDALNFKNKEKKKAELEPKLAYYENKGREADEELRNFEEKKLEIKNKLEENRQAKEELAKISEIKLLLGRGLREEQLLEAREKSLVQLETELVDKNKEVQSMEESLKKLKEEKEQLGEVDEKKLFEKEKELYKIGSAEIKELEEKLFKIAGKVEAEEKLIKKLEAELPLLEEKQNKHRKNLALELASTLKEGEACMVCGSLHHPNIAHGSLLEEDFSEVYDRLIEIKSRLRGSDLSEKKEEFKLIEQKLGGRSYAEALEKEKKIKAELNEIRESNKELLAIKEKYEELIKGAEVKKDRAAREQIALEERKLSWQEERQNIENSLEEIKKSFEKIDSLYISVTIINYELVKGQVSQSEEKYVLFEKYGQDFDRLEKEMEKYRAEREMLAQKIKEAEGEIRVLEGELVHMERLKARSMEEFERALADSSFARVEELKDALMEENEKMSVVAKIEGYKKAIEKCKNSIEMLEAKIGDRKADREGYEENLGKVNELKNKMEENKKTLGKMTAEKERMEKIRVEVEGLMKEREREEKELDKYEDLSSLFEGNKFVEFLALGKIRSIARNAGQRLENISGGRYGLETDRDGNFLIVDNFNGGEMRKSPTLSGGESFLVSLSLALALSSQIQLKGQAQLEFFFLDEGFGTLDSVLLDKVMTSLEKLRSHEGLKVGIISHVEELKDRVPRKVEIIPPVSGEKGSLVKTI